MVERCGFAARALPWGARLRAKNCTFESCAAPKCTRDRVLFARSDAQHWLISARATRSTLFSTRAPLAFPSSQPKATAHTHKHSLHRSLNAHSQQHNTHRSLPDGGRQGRRRQGPGGRRGREGEGIFEPTSEAREGQGGPGRGRGSRGRGVWFLAFAGARPHRRCSLSCSLSLSLSPQTLPQVTQAQEKSAEERAKEPQQQGVPETAAQKAGEVCFVMFCCVRVE